MFNSLFSAGGFMPSKVKDLKESWIRPNRGQFCLFSVHLFADGGETGGWINSFKSFPLAGKTFKCIPNILTLEHQPPFGVGLPK